MAFFLLVLVLWCGLAPASEGAPAAGTPPERHILTLSSGAATAPPVTLAGAGNEHLFLCVEIHGTRGAFGVKIEGEAHQPPLSWRFYRLAAAPAPSPPDALLPLEEPGDGLATTPPILWLSLYIPPGYPPGLHEQRLVITNGRGNLIVPLRLQVFHFTLPEDLPVTLCGGLWHQGQPGVLREVPVIKAYYRSLREYRFNALGGAWPLPLAGGKGEGEDFTIFQELTTYALNDLKFRAVQLPSPKGWQQGSEADRPFGSQARRWYPQVAAYLRRHGWEGRALAYVADEPRPAEHEQVYQAYSLVKSLAPGVRTLGAGWAPRRDFPRVIDIWAFQAGHYREAEVRAAREAGQEVWLYANRFHTSGRPLAHPRFIGWLLYRYGFSGYLLWGVNYWPENPWTTPPGPRDFFRRGTFYYPHPRTGLPVPTTRLEALRRGFQDYQYLVLLDQAARAGRVPPGRYRDIQAQVAGLTDNLARTPGPATMAPLEGLRLEIGGLLDNPLNNKKKTRHLSP